MLSHKAADHKAARTRSLVTSVEQLGLITNVFAHSVGIRDGLLVNTRMPLRNEQADATCQVRVVSMMEVVRLAAFHKPGSIAQVMGHARLNGNDFRIGILRAQQRLGGFHHLAGFHQLACYEPAHGVFVHARAHQALEFLVSDKPGIVQRAPISRHALTDSGVKQHRVRLTLIFLAQHQGLVLVAIVLDVRARNDVINLVKPRVRKLRDIDRLARIQALAVLHEIQREPFIKFIRAYVFQLRQNPLRPLRILLLEIRQRILEIVVTTLGAAAFLLHIVIAGHLDKNMRGRLAGNANDLIDDANSLVEAATHRRRARQVVDAKGIARLLEIRSIECIDLILEPKTVVVQNLHEHHRAATAVVRIRIALAQDVHDRLLVELRIHLQAREELLRQAAPSSETLFANRVDLRVIKTALALGAILLLQLLTQNVAILEQRVPLDDLFDHGVIGLLDLPRFEHVFREENVR